MRPPLLHLSPEPGAIVQHGDVECDTSRHKVGGNGGERTLGTAGREAVDQIKNTHVGCRRRETRNRTDSVGRWTDCIRTVSTARRLPGQNP
jgi:hypothetical protein